MIWLAFVALQFVMVYRMYRHAKAENLWSWSGFAFSIAFALFEAALITLPAYLLRNNPWWMWRVYALCWVVAAVNFIFFIRIMRRWKLGTAARVAAVQTPRDGSSQ
jgi:hypothetical protein